MEDLSINKTIENYLKDFPESTADFHKALKEHGRVIEVTMTMNRIDIRFEDKTRQSFISLA